MRVSIIRATGRVFEMQSHATAGTLIRNAVEAGLTAEDIEEREVDQAEYEALLAAQPKTTLEHIREVERASGMTRRERDIAITALVAGHYWREKAEEAEAAIIALGVRKP